VRGWQDELKVAVKLLAGWLSQDQRFFATRRKTRLGDGEILGARDPLNLREATLTSDIKTLF